VLHAFKVNIIVDDVMHEVKYRNKSIILLKDFTFIAVRNSFIIDKGKFSIINNNKEYDTFVLRSDKTMVSILMLDNIKNIALYTFNENNVSKTTIIKI